MDVTDGITPEVAAAVTIAASDEAEILKADGAATVAMTGALTDVTGCPGWLDYTMATGDVDTTGTLDVVMQDASVYMPVSAHFQVISQAAFDIMYKSGALGPVELDTNALPAFQRAAGSIVLVTIGASSSTTNIIVSSISPASTVDDQFNTRIMIFARDTTTAALRGQQKDITDFDHSGQNFTTTAFTTAPVSGDTAVIL